MSGLVEGNTLYDFFVGLDAEETFFSVQIPESQLSAEVSRSKSCDVPQTFREGGDSIGVFVHACDERVCENFVDFCPNHGPLVLPGLKCQRYFLPSGTCG